MRFQSKNIRHQGGRGRFSQFTFIRYLEHRRFLESHTEYQYGEALNSNVRYMYDEETTEKNISNFENIAQRRAINVEYSRIHGTRSHCCSPLNYDADINSRVLDKASNTSIVHTPNVSIIIGRARD